MSSPKAPPPPDYAAAAEAQGEASRETAITNNALNRVNQIGPNGSIEYTLREGADPDNPRPGDYIQTTYLGEPEQRQHEGLNRISESVLGTAERGLTRVDEAMSTPFSTEGMAELRGAGEVPTYTKQTGSATYQNAPDASSFPRAATAASLVDGPGAQTYQGGPEAATYSRAPAPASLSGYDRTSATYQAAPGAQSYRSAPGAVSYQEAPEAATYNRAASAPTYGVQSGTSSLQGAAAPVTGLHHQRER